MAYCRVSRRHWLRVAMFMKFDTSNIEQTDTAAELCWGSWSPSNDQLFDVAYQNYTQSRTCNYNSQLSVQEAGRRRHGYVAMQLAAAAGCWQLMRLKHDYTCTQDLRTYLLPAAMTPSSSTVPLPTVLTSIDLIWSNSVQYFFSCYASAFKGTDYCCYCSCWNSCRY